MDTTKVTPSSNIGLNTTSGISRIGTCGGSNQADSTMNGTGTLFLYSANKMFCYLTQSATPTSNNPMGSAYYGLGNSTLAMTFIIESLPIQGWGAVTLPPLELKATVCNYRTTASQSISSAGSTVIYNTLDASSVNCSGMNTSTGVFTAPHRGVWTVSAGIGVLTATNSTVDINIYFNGVQKVNNRSCGTTSNISTPNASYSGFLDQGQTVHIIGAPVVTSNLSGDGGQNYISISSTGI